MEREGRVYHLGSDLGFTFGSLIFLSILYFVLTKFNKIPSWVPYESILFIVSLIFLYKVLRK